MLQDVCQTSSNIYTGLLKGINFESRVELVAGVVELGNVFPERNYIYKARRLRIDIMVNNPYSSTQILILGLILLFIITITAGCSVMNLTGQTIPDFNGERAYKDIESQVSFGPRIPGTPGQDQILQWLNEELSQYKWKVELQVHEIKGKTITNLVASRGEDGKYILLGAGILLLLVLLQKGRGVLLGPSNVTALLIKSSTSIVITIYASTLNLLCLVLRRIGSNNRSLI